MRKNRIIIVILICLLLLPLNTLAITYGKTGADTNFDGDVNVPSGSNYYINGIVLSLGEANTASNIGAQIPIYKQKTGVDLELRTLKADSNQIMVTTAPVGGEIDIGSPAIDRPVSSPTKTYVEKSNPANATGRITSIEIWADTNLVDCEVATFFVVSGNNLSTRDTHTIGSVTAGSKQTFVVDLAVETGDYLGIYFSAGGIERTSAGDGTWYCNGDNIPCTNTTFTSVALYQLSVYGTGVTSTLDYIRFGINEENIKLDDLGAPDDNTDLNASITKHGLLPKMPIAGTVAVTANKLSDFAATTSAELAGAISDETGTDKLVYNTSPTLVTPTGVLCLLSTTTVSFAADGDTTLYTVPTGKRCVLHSAIIVAAADAGATTTVSIGQDTVETDFVPANTLSNLDAQYDSVILMPIPNTTPLAIKSYAAATVIQAQVATQSGAAGNTIYLFGILY